MNISTPTKFIPKYHAFHDTVTNTKAYATLVTEHNFSGCNVYSLSFVFLVISVNVDNVIFCK